MLMFHGRLRLSLACLSTIKILWKGIMELSQAVVILWCVPVSLQILLPLTLLSGFLLLRTGQQMFGMKIRPSVESRFIE
jgi:hypothetical protein